MLFFNRSTSAGLPSAPTSFWGKLKPKNKEGDLRQQATTQMAIARQRLLTLVCGEHETLHLVCSHPVHFSLGVTLSLLHSFQTHSLFVSCFLLSFNCFYLFFSGIGKSRSKLDKASPRCPVSPSCSGRVCFPACCCRSRTIFLLNPELIYSTAIGRWTLYLCVFEWSSVENNDTDPRLS